MQYSKVLGGYGYKHNASDILNCPSILYEKYINEIIVFTPNINIETSIKL